MLFLITCRSIIRAIVNKKAGDSDYDSELKTGTREQTLVFYFLEK